ncbi:hypothetical protein [Epilithonimonas lactis]|nr:hypothetical protein [Epilithonimonas lactis]SEP64314.1 hypothetical protein SAMN04488097_0187 [Epilithonimonas lactis]
MGSYLPDKVYTVCMNQLGTEYKQLTIDNEMRPKANQTVKLGSQNRVFLVVLDKKLTADFKCKSGWSSGAGTVAFGAGIAVGMAATVGVGIAAGLTVAAAVAVIPVAGWIVGGAIAIGCLIWGAVQMMQSPTCSEMIGYEESKWVMHHQTVRFDSQNVSIKEKHLALVKNSKLVCKEPGGVLLPFISETLAAQAAKAIGENNQTEMKWGVAAGFISGFMLGNGFGWGALGQYVVWMGIGHYALNPAANWFGDTTGAALGNETYDEIKENAYQDPEWWEDPTENAATINPNDEYNAPDDINDIKNLTDIRDNLIKNKGNANHIAQINAALERANANGGSLSARNNPEMKAVLAKIKAGEFGEEVRRIYTNSRGTMGGMNTTANAQEAIDSKQSNIRANNRANLATGAKAIGGAIQILQPFVCAYYGERAVRLAAEIFDQDATNSVSVISKDY